jgi:hypothetical protein
MKELKQVLFRVQVKEGEVRWRRRHSVVQAGGRNESTLDFEFSFCLAS